MSTESKLKLKSVEIPVPDDVTLSLNGDKVSVGGKLGTLRMDFSKAKVQFTLDGKILRITTSKKGRRGDSILGTVKKKILNMMRGVNERYVVKMKIVHSHFPITVKRAGNLLRIENFIGERSPRLVEIPDGVEIEVKGTDLLVKGIDKDSVTLLSGSIQSRTRITGKDSRVFLDGIYILEKGYESEIREG